jgi:tetratricopeptide (TPR) repeat protein
MKMNMKSSLLGLMLVILTSATTYAQCKGTTWPEDKEKAEENNALYTDALKQKNYRGAVKGFQWLLTNAPKLNTGLYINGTDIYNNLAAAEKDPAKKQVLVDSLMMLYDMRITNCGDMENVLNRKAIYAATYNAQNKAKTAEVLALYDKVFEISGNNVLENNLLTYMQVIQLNDALLKNLTDDQVLQRYDKLSEVIDAKIKKAQSENKQADVDRLKKTKSSIDEILPKIVQVDCDFVRTKMQPNFRKNPTDLGLAKKMFQFMTAGGCIDDPLWLETAEVIHKDSPDYGLAINMAKIYAKNGNLEKAESLATEAITLASTPEQKESSSILVGDLLAQKGNKAAAREAYRKAGKAGFEKIGDLYMGSGKDCSKGVSLAEDRLVYLAAYDMYVKAGDGQKMATAKAQFPSVTELFELNWKEGESKSISCWVGETVVLRTRGKE